LSERTSNIERKILRALEKAGEKGVIQRELWGMLGVDSRSGARIVARLERMGLVKRKRIMYKGKATYLLKIHEEAKIEMKILEEIKEIPCFTCQYLDICGEGGSVTPEKCMKLLQWLEKAVEQKSKNTNTLTVYSNR